ncbi:MAG: anthranilate phosphoribosyltransferase, partial [Solirubrobacterales bacterium]|nr:anthranilate phosphoribosyltransferase [Solirubrobacterales bacterium]
VRTTFNFLGPLTTPAGAKRQLLGCSVRAQQPKLAGALKRLGTRHALVVNSEDGLDELSISAATHVIEVQDGGDTREYTITPEEVGLKRHLPEDVPGGDPTENAAITRAILAGEPGAARDLAVLNAGAAVYAAGGAVTLQSGINKAQQAIDTGAAASTLERFVEATQRLPALS